MSKHYRWLNLTWAPPALVAALCLSGAPAHARKVPRLPPPRPPAPIPTAPLPEVEQNPRLAVPFNATPGVNLSGSTVDEPMLAAAQSQGMAWARLTIPWRAVEPQSGAYDFGPYDALVDGCRKHRLHVIAVLDGPSPAFVGAAAPISGAGPAAFARFAAAAAAHFRHRVAAWQIWDRPNTDHWAPQPDPIDYAALVKLASAAIRKADKRALVAGGATQGIDLPFTQATVSQGILRALDAVAFRLPTPQPADGRVQAMDGLRQARTDPAATHQAALWCSGVSAPAGLAGAPLAQWMARALLLNYSCGVTVTLFDSADLARLPAPPGGLSALLARLKDAILLRRMELPAGAWGVELARGKRPEIESAVWTDGALAVFHLRARHGAPRLSDLDGYPLPAPTGHDFTLSAGRNLTFLTGRFEVTGVDLPGAPS